MRANGNGFIHIQNSRIEIESTEVVFDFEQQPVPTLLQFQGDPILIRHAHSDSQVPVDLFVVQKDLHAVIRAEQQGEGLILRRVDVRKGINDNQLIRLEFVEIHSSIR